MSVHLGVDDTDAPEGMCTTYLLTEILRELDFPVLHGHPKLVRLNPNIPWKTRGNGALSVSIGGDPGRAVTVGEISGRKVLASPYPGPSPETDEVFEAACRTVERLAQFRHENTNPGVAVSSRMLPESFYWHCVRSIAEKEEALLHLRSSGALFRGWKNGRGLIGAAAAISWPARNKTYELIAYRIRQMWGKERVVSEQDVAMLSNRFPTTFSNYDSANRHICITPSSPCPVLLGIRGTVWEDLYPALRSLRSETVERWLIFETNQATDDHIETDPEEILPYHSYLLSGTVNSRIETIRGGHCFFALDTGYGPVVCSVFEETKELRNIVRKLIPGDRVSVWGAFKPSVHGYALNIEKIRIDGLAPLVRKIANPACPGCGKRMQSAGAGEGYRCRRCHVRVREAPSIVEPRDLDLGIYGVAVSSRRHLSMPPEGLAGATRQCMSGKRYLSSTR